MKRNTALLLVLCLLLTIPFTACSASPESLEQDAKGDIQMGVWSEDNTVFVNKWSGIKFALPDNWRALTAEEMSATIGAGEEMLINDGRTTRKNLDMSKTQTVFDFSIMSAHGLPNVAASYVNLALTSDMEFMDEKGYYDVIKRNLLSLSSVDFAEIGTTSKTVASEVYLIGAFSANQGTSFQDYYLRKTDNVMITFVVTYTDETKAEADAFIASIEKA